MIDKCARQMSRETDPEMWNFLEASEHVEEAAIVLARLQERCKVQQQSPDLLPAGRARQRLHLNPLQHLSSIPWLPNSKNTMCMRSPR